jgi:hypothetical protein
MKGDRDGEAARVGGMAKADVTAFLADGLIAKLS